MRAWRMLIVLVAFLPSAGLCAADEKPAAKGEPAPAYEKLGAFEVVRWKEDPAAGPEVELGGIKYELREVQDLPIATVLEFCREHYPKDWRKAFEEDLIEVTSKMGKPPEGTLKVKVRPSEGGEERTFDAVWLTEANLDSIVKNRQIVVPGAGVGAVPAAGGAARRVERPHAGAVAEKFRFLTDRIEPRSPEGKDVMSRQAAEEDLDELEWLLVNRFAYLGRTDLDYAAALDSVRAAVGEKGVARGVFAVQVRRLLSLFGDGDTGAMLDLQHDLAEGYLPFLVAEAGGGKVVAYDPGGAGLVDLDRPVLAKLDGVDAEKWVEAAARLASGGSPQAVRRQAVEGLKFVNHLRDALKLPRKPTLSVELSSPDGTNGHAIEMTLAEEPVKPPLPREGLRRTLEGNVGYLRLAAAAADDAAFVKALHEAMAESRATEGLVIDVRRGGGAGPAALRELFPYFMEPDEKPLVAGVAAYRLNAEKNEAPDAKDGYLSERQMFPMSGAAWGDAERAAIAAFARTFDPQWQPPALRFSAWHCMVLAPRANPPYYHYDKPVVVLADAGSSGAAELLLGAFKGRRGVTLMGTASAGATGRSEGARLANSGVAVRVSTVASYRPDGRLYDGQGVEPDAEAWPAPNDFIGRTDSVLEAAVKRVKGK